MSTQIVGQCPVCGEEYQHHTNAPGGKFTLDEGDGRVCFHVGNDGSLNVFFHEDNARTEIL